MTLPNQRPTDLSALDRLSASMDALQDKVEAQVARATPDTEAIISRGVARAEAILKPIATGLEAEIARRGIQHSNTTAASVDGMRFGEAVNHLLHNT